MSFERKRGIDGGMRPVGIALMALLWLSCFVFWRFQGGFVSGFLFYTVTVLGLYEGLVWWAGGYGWTVVTEIQQRTWTKGEDMVVRIRLCRRFPMPLIWLQVEPVLPRRLWRIYRAESGISWCWFGRRIEWVYRLGPLPRGRFVLTGVRLTCGDAFGLMTRRLHVAQEQEVEFVVVPHWRPLYGWSAEVGERTAAGSAVQRLSRFPANDATVAGVRDWRPGDRLNQIHWKASARAVGLKTKWSEPSGSRPVVVVLDLHRDSYRETESSLLERGIELALSLAHAVTASGLGVGLWAAGQEPIWIHPATGFAQLQRLAHVLALVEADGTTPLSSLLDTSSWPAKTDAEWLIVTPKLDAGLVEAIRRQVQAPSAAGIRVFWLTGGRPGKRHPGWVLRQWGVPVYAVDDDQWSTRLGTVLQRGGGAHGLS